MTAAGWRSGLVRSDHGGRPFGSRAAQPSGQFLRQFAKRVALDGAQARRPRLGRRRCTKRHNISGGRNDAEPGVFRLRHRRIGFGLGARGHLRDGRNRGLGDRGRNCSALFRPGAHIPNRRRWRFRLGRKAKRPRLPLARQLIDPVDIAANAKATISTKHAIAIEHRQSGQLNRQTLAGIVHRPLHRYAAPGLARRDSVSDPIVGIEFQFGGDLAPRPAAGRGGARANKFGKFVRADGEPIVGVHVPDEAQRMPAFSNRRGAIRGRLFGWWCLNPCRDARHGDRERQWICWRRRRFSRHHSGACRDFWFSRRHGRGRLFGFRCALCERSVAGRQHQRERA